MLKDITLGQFFPGTSVVHRADPRVKLVLTLLYVVVLFICKNLYSFSLVVLASFLFVLLSGISFKVILKSIKPVIFLMAFTAVINIFWTKGEGDPLFALGFIKVWEKGIVNAVFMVARVLSLITATSVLLTYTTSPIALTDALERLLKPLKKIHVPVHEFAMMMTIALRFIPTLLEETDKIIAAQKARGASFDRGSLIDKVKAFIPILIPLFISAFRRADDLACAMECRCYRGDEGRTRMKILTLSRTDFGVIAVFVLFLTVLLVLNSINCPITL